MVIGRKSLLFALSLGVAVNVLADLSLVPRTAAATAPTAEKAARAPARPGPRKAAARPAKKKLARFAPVELFQVNRREVCRLRLYDGKGRSVRGVDRTMRRFLRCHHTNKDHRIDPRLVRLIYATGRHYDGRRIEVISGYRHPTAAKNPKSPHKQGLACDFRVVGVSNQDLRDYVRKTFKNVGVGYYPNSHFVHVDVRKGPSAFWIDYSKPGQDAMYSENAAEDLRTGRADTWKPTTIDPSFAAAADANAAPAETAN